jgi:hypothetical protein
MLYEFVPYEIALELKELGFDEECFSFYDTTDKELHLINRVYNNQLEGAFIAPLYQQAFRWFMNKHMFFSYILREQSFDEQHIVYQGIYHKISKRGNSPNSTCRSKYTYEEAQIELLKHLIETVKQKRC